MPVSLNVNGTTYQYPSPGDTNWGTDATGWASAVTTGMLQKAGGSFTLTAEVDFGATFGLKSVYYKTATANIATAGQFRLAQADVISWRNAANSANLDLSLTADALYFGGNEIALVSDLSGYQPLDAELTAISGLATDGLIAKTGAGTAATRTVTGTGNNIVVSNGDGVAGNPTIDIGTDVVTLTGTQTLTNKTLTTPAISSPTVSGTLLLQNASGAQPEVRFSEDPDNGTNYVALKAAAAMAANYDIFWPNAQGLIGTTLVNDGSGNLSWAQSAGSGQISVITNQSEATGWTASGAGITVGTTTTAAQLPLAGVVNTAIRITPVSGTDYVYYRWTMPSSLKNMKLGIFWYQLPESGYANGDLKVEVYKNSASNYGGSYTEFDLQGDVSGTSAINNVAGPYVNAFNSDDGDYYEMRIVRVAGTTPLNMAQVIVGPGVTSQGAAVEREIKTTTLLTPESSRFGTISSPNYWYQRVGTMMEVRGVFLAGTLGGVDANSYMTLNGFTIDTTDGAASGARTKVGDFVVLDASGANFGSDNRIGAMYVDSSQNNRIYFCKSVTGNSFTPNISGSNNSGFAFKFGGPIAEWAGKGVVNTLQEDNLKPPTAYTPTFTGLGTVTAINVNYSRVGSKVIIQGGFKTGTVTAASVSMSLPPGLTINTTLHTPNQSLLGIASANSAAPVQVFSAGDGTALFNDVSDATKVFFCLQNDTITNDKAFSPQNGNAIFNSNSRLAFMFEADIVEYANSQNSLVGFAGATNTSLGLVKLPGDYSYVNTGNGNGSTATRRRNFSGTPTTVGTALTYAQSGTNGSTWTVNQKGVYSVTYGDSGSAQWGAAIARNTNGTTNPGSLTAFTQRLAKQTIAAGFEAVLNWSGVLDVGDVVEMINDTAANGTNTEVFVWIVQQAKL